MIAGIKRERLYFGTSLKKQKVAFLLRTAYSVFKRKFCVTVKVPNSYNFVDFQGDKQLSPRFVIPW